MCFFFHLFLFFVIYILIYTLHRLYILLIRDWASEKQNVLLSLFFGNLVWFNNNTFREKNHLKLRYFVNQNCQQNSNSKTIYKVYQRNKQLLKIIKKQKITPKILTLMIVTYLQYKFYKKDVTKFNGKWWLIR